MILENKKGIEKSKRDSREIRVFKRKCMRLSWWTRERETHKLVLFINQDRVYNI